MARFRPVPTLILLIAALDAGAATPESALLAGLAADYREPQQRCEQLAGRFERIERTLSLYREELSDLRVLVDGLPLAESSTGALQLLAFESRLLGPASVTMAIDPRHAVSPGRLAPGRRIEISFTDRAGKVHPLFCGFAALVRPDATGVRTEVVALVPRAGAELRTSAQYLNQTCVEVLKGVVQAEGLAVEVTDGRVHGVSALIVRKSLATWPFLCQLARQCGMNLVLPAGGKLLASESSYVPPPAPPARTWTDMTWVEVAASLAQAAGRAPDARLTGSYPSTNFRQNASDEDFLLEITTAAQASAWFTPGKLMIVEDGAWLRDSFHRPTPDGTSDLLLKRVIVTGSGASPRAFSRRYADPRAQALDPERVPTVEATLLLGRAMPAAALPVLPLASAAQIATALEAALARLDARTGTPEQRFLRNFARHYRPTLHYLYRLRPGGAKFLDTIGR